MKGLLIQEFKSLFKTPASLSILIIPIVLLVGLGYLLPSGWIVPSTITIGIVGSVLLYFGGSIEEIKRTSFMKSISLTRLNKFTFVSIKILFSVFISLISVLWVLFFSWFFSDVVHFLADDFSHLIPSDSVDSGPMLVIRKISFSIDWSKINWFVILYSGAITIVVSFAIAFVFVSFSKSSLSFYLMSFGYLLSMILFGGIIMPSFLISEENDWFKNLYYLIPNFFTNNIMATAFNNGLGPFANNIANFFETTLIPLLGGFEEIPTDADLVLINELFESGSLGGIGGGKPVAWDGSMTDLNIWYDSLTLEQKTPFIEEVYNFLLIPESEFGVETWNNAAVVVLINNEEFFVNFLDSLFGIYIGDYYDVAMNFLYDGSILWSGINIPDAVIPDSIYEGSLTIPPIFQSITNTIAMGETINLINSLDSFSQTLVEMFNTADSLDYIIPWVETIIFLTISTLFFKWS